VRKNFCKSEEFLLAKYNLLIVMYTEKKEVLERFDKLPYSKKVCIVPFHSALPSAYCIDKNDFESIPLWDCANRIAMGRKYIYNLWDMIIYGKKNHL
jgi:uncharacterized protein (DUF1919 family)